MAARTTYPESKRHERVTVHRITIESRADEGPCDSCGFQLYTGDRAWMLEDGIACSKSCARRLAESGGSY